MSLSSRSRIEWIIQSLVKKKLEICGAKERRKKRGGRMHVEDGIRILLINNVIGIFNSRCLVQVDTTRLVLSDMCITSPAS